MKQMIVHCDPNSTQMALLENGKLVEFSVERSHERGLVGSFFKGIVVNVIPGMQAAFVDIGQKKNAFLYIDDVLHPHLEKQPKIKPSITELLKVGQELVVQVIKDAIGGKGARVTTHYSLPGRWIVYMPDAGYTAVSKKISPESERNRLRILGEQLRDENEGMILRTVADGEKREAIEDDLIFLRNEWKAIQAKSANKQSAPYVLHQDLSMVRRLMRDVYSPQTDELIMDCREQAQEALSFLESMLPGELPKIQIHEKELSVFETYGVQQQLETDFKRKIWMPGGGYLVWDQTEAFTVIDVNTGKFVGSNNLEDTIFQTNVQAAGEIARLLRLRDTGGIVIIDFIDMDNDAHRQYVVDKLQSSMQGDRTQHHVLGWTRLGLLEMTRKKMREESVSYFIETCRACEGTGKINIRTMS